MAGPDGKVGHAELQIGDSVIMLADEYPDMGIRSPKTVGGTPVTISVYVEDVDAVFERAFKEGATGTARGRGPVLRRPRRAVRGPVRTPLERRHPRRGRAAGRDGPSARKPWPADPSRRQVARRAGSGRWRRDFLDPDTSVHDRRPPVTRSPGCSPSPRSRDGSRPGRRPAAPRPRAQPTSAFAAPRNPSRSGKVRSDLIISRASRSVSGVIRTATSFRISAWTPPAPHATTGPNSGSWTTPDQHLDSGRRHLLDQEAVRVCPLRSRRGHPLGRGRRRASPSARARRPPPRSCGAASAQPP